jgi:hypothetical protein
MAATSWWVIAFTSYGSAPTYEYFQGTQAQAEAKANFAVKVSDENNLSGPYPSKAAAENAVKGKKVNVPNNDANTSPSQILSGLDAIGAFFNNLGLASTWIRVAKVVIGGTLVVIGIAHMTGASNAIASTARKVPLPI